MQKSTAKEMGLDYWLKWQVPVCALVMVIPAAVSIKLIKSRKKDVNEVSFEELWIPRFRMLNPKWLLLYRACALLTMSWLLYQMVLYAGLFAFYFYTQWTFSLVILYFAVATIISARGCFMPSDKSKSKSSEKNELLTNGSDAQGISTGLQKRNANNAANQGAGFLGSLMQIIYETSAGASVLTDLVFWCILMPMLSGKDFELTFVIACIHSVNAIFLVIDSLLNSLPFQWFGFNYFILWTVSYATFQWVLHACGFTWWPYPFLELSTPFAPLWYLGIAVVHIPCYGLYVLFVRAKNSIFSKLFPGALRSYEDNSHQKKAA